MSALVPSWPKIGSLRRGNSRYSEHSLFCGDDFRLHSQSGETVFDPFLGSGTTLIAAENLDRVCYGIEIEPKYVAVILQRYQDAFSVEPARA